MMSEVVSHSGKNLTVPVPVTAVPVGGGAELCAVALASDDTACDEPDAGAASTKAEGGNPPMIAASPAFSA